MPRLAWLYFTSEVSFFFQCHEQLSWWSCSRFSTSIMPFFFSSPFFSLSARFLLAWWIAWALWPVHATPVAGEFSCPDLVIRTSGEVRLSNCLMWQSAYSELYFTDTLWPDFGEAEYLQALSSFQTRERRFGVRNAFRWQMRNVKRHVIIVAYLVLPVLRF